MTSFFLDFDPKEISTSFVARLFIIADLIINDCVLLLEYRSLSPICQLRNYKKLVGTVPLLALLSLSPSAMILLPLKSPPLSALLFLRVMTPLKFPGAGDDEVCAGDGGCFFRGQKQDRLSHIAELAQLCFVDFCA